MIIFPQFYLVQFDIHGVEAGVVIMPVPLLGHLQGGELCGVLGRVPHVKRDELLARGRPERGEPGHGGLTAPAQGQNVRVLHHLRGGGGILEILRNAENDSVRWRSFIFSLNGTAVEENTLVKTGHCE